MRDEIGDLIQRIRALPDSSLLAMLEHERDQYTSEALSIAEEEAESRGLRHSDREEGTHLQNALVAKRKRPAENLLSRLIGRPPSKRYPALSNVSVALRLISFALAFVVLGSSVLGISGLFSGSPFAWFASVWSGLITGVAALLFYGSSELINVVLDIEKNTRE